MDKDDNKKEYREEMEELKSSLAEIGYQVEETDSGELKVSEPEK